MGIKLGRKDVTIVLVDFTGVVIDRVFLQQDLSQPEAEMELILQQSNQLFSNNPGSALRLASIGVAAPFRLGAWHNELGLDQETSDRLAAWAGFDVVDALEQSFGCDVFMENDRTAAAIAEMLFGVGKRVNNFVYLFLDVVIGGRVVCDGDILRGTNSNEGDLALMRIGSPGQSSLLLEHASLFLLLNKLRAYP
ncbi:MAG: ROK family protein [Deltaproteobacteria bacterium]|nr:ROK family protein [Deltaproteobacteria bacterium]